MRFSLSLQQRISIAFLTMSVLILIASGSGMLFTTAVLDTTTAARQGIDQFEGVNGVQDSWLTLITNVDKMLLIRELSPAEASLIDQIETFNQKLKTLQSMPTGQNSAAAGVIQSEVENLLVTGEGLSTLVEELLQAARVRDWDKAQMLRDTELAAQQQVLNESLSLLNQNIQGEINATAAYSARIQRFTHSYWLFTAFTALAVGIALAVLTARTITGSVHQLITQVQRVTSGDPGPVHPLSRKDELGDLSRAVTSMIAGLRESMQASEDRAARNTLELEKRTLQLKAVAEATRDAACLHNLDELLERTATLVQCTFGYDQTGIYLMEEGGEAAVLRAAAGKDGGETLAQGQRIKVGEESLVGSAAKSGQARTVLGLNPEMLPGTDQRLHEDGSQAALPIVIGDRVAGVLAVRCRSGIGTREEDFATLQVLADQLSIAIEKASLLDQVRENKSELECLHSRYSREAWEKAIQARPVSGYQFGRSGLAPIRSQSSNEAESGAESQVMPVRIPLESRGAAIGVLEVWPGQRELSNDEIASLEAIGQKVSQAMETAQLYQETHQRTVRDRLAKQIVDKFHALSDPHLILQTAVQELCRALDTSQVQIILRPVQPSAQDSVPGEAE